MDKSPDAFRTISEVATELDLPQHVLRFWETRFSQIKPMKRGGGRRYYRPEDVELLCGIRHLLYGEGYTIKGVQRILKEQGVRYVMDIWQEAAGADGEETGEAERVEAPETEAESEEGEVFAGVPTRREPAGPVAEAREAPPVSLAKAEAAAPAEARIASAAKAQRPAPIAHEQDEGFNGQEEEPAPRDVLPDTVAPQADEHPGARSSFRFMERLRGENKREAVQGAHAEPGNPLSRDDVRRLQATLFELLECKRILDQSR